MFYFSFLNGFLFIFILFGIYLDHEVNLASILILENFAVPANQDDTPTPLSRYSSSESVLRLDGGNSSSSGSVAEKAMMFELTASMQNNRTSPMPRTNGISDGQKSPSRFSSSPRRGDLVNDAQKQSNGNIKNVTNGDDKTTNVQDLLTQKMLTNRSWGDIMDTES